jgi:ferritin-like metal-binding protein YciE
MTFDSLRSLYIHQLRDLYSAESQLARGLSRFMKDAASPELKAAFKEHQKQTKDHVRRLEEVFARMGEQPQGQRCKGMAALIKEGKDLVKEGGDDAIVDAGIIAAAQKAEHYEISGYGTARTMASMLREDDAAEVLQQILNEEGRADQKLTEISEAMLSVAGDPSDRTTDIAMEADRRPGGSDMANYDEALADEDRSPAQPIYPAGTGAHWEEQPRQPREDPISGD